MKVVCDNSVTSAPWRPRSWSPAAVFSGGTRGAWYDPSNLNSLFQDVAGTVPVTSDGDPVALIRDISGNDNHGVQDVSSARPTWRTDGTLCWLEFDGVNDKIITPQISYLDPNLSICTGLRYANSGNSWGSVKSASNSVVYVGLSHPSYGGSISNCGGDVSVNGADAPNDRIALRNALLSDSVVSVHAAQSASFTTSNTFVGYSGTLPPSAILYGYVEIEGAAPETVGKVEQWMAGKTGISF